MLNNYVQYNPNKIIFGKDSEKEVGKLIKEYNATKVLIHYDSGDFILPLIEKIKGYLLAEGLEVFELGGVVPNPKLSLMKEGCKLVKENNIDFILAVGGGSTMDSSKYIACGTYYDGDIWNHPKFTKIKTPVIKHGVIVTMPGTGSDVSTAAVWRDDIIQNLLIHYQNFKLQQEVSILSHIPWKIISVRLKIVNSIYQHMRVLLMM